MSDFAALEEAGGPRPLVVAAGGGGDAIAALLVARWVQGRADARPIVASFAWERKLFDPVPGPRTPRDFVALKPSGQANWRVVPGARLTAGETFLPRLVAESHAELYLLDPSGGGRYLRRQIRELMRLSRATGALVVDVGGDILAEGSESWLKSPLADSLALAGVLDVRDVGVVVLGLGLDGEVTERDARLIRREATRRDALAAARVPSRTARSYLSYFNWHPSEAAGLTCLAAVGFRGRAELRADGLEATLNDTSAQAYLFSYDYVLRRNRFAEPLAETASLHESDAVVRSVRGRTELDVERDALERHQLLEWIEFPTADELVRLEGDLLQYSAGAGRRGIQFLTFRRIAELLRVRGDAFESTRRWLRRRHGSRLTAPVWRCIAG